MGSKRVTWASLGLALVSSCFYDWNRDQRGASDGGGGIKSGGSGGTQLDGASGGGAPGGTGGGVGASGGSGPQGGGFGGIGNQPGGGGTSPNGGFGGTSTSECKTYQDCSSQNFCDFEANDCGLSAGIAKCAPIEATTCSPDSRCGCDGVFYDSDCAAYKNFVDVGPASACKPQTGFFPCGLTFCKVTGYLCVSQTGAESCMPYSDCAGAGCDECRLKLCPAGKCTTDTFSGYTLTCP